MRIPVAYEGRDTGNGRVVLDGALTLPDSVPVTLRGNDGLTHQVGTATRFERTADGVIWATISLNPQIEVGDAVLADAVPGGLIFFQSATLTSVHLSSNLPRRNT